MQATKSHARFEVVADGQGICSHVGAALLSELSDRLGLTGELGRRANLGRGRGAHDRGQVLRDLVVMLADGGDCVSDLATLRDQPELFGQVASTSTAWRVLVEEVGCAPRQVAALWSALARVRERVELPRFRGQLNACQDTDPEERARAPNQTPYPPEFRAEAVRLLRTSGKTPREVAQELGISRQSLVNWARQADRDAGHRDDGLTTSQQQELRELRRRLRIAEEERDILKKAVAFFVRETGQR